MATPKRAAKQATLASRSRPSTKAPATVAAYIAAQPAPVRARLAEARAAIRAAVPGVGEVIAYGMARFTLDGEMLLYLAGWKKHYSIYPAYPSITQALAGELAAFEVAKGTIRFPLTAAVPTALIARIASLRADQVRADAAAKRPGARATKPTKPRTRRRA